MKLFRIDFTSLRKPENAISLAAFSFLGLGTVLGIWMMGPNIFSMDVHKLLSFTDFMLGVVSFTGIGYLAAMGMLEGPEDTVTVEAQENQENAPVAGKQWYLKI